MKKIKILHNDEPVDLQLKPWKRDQTTLWEGLPLEIITTNVSEETKDVYFPKTLLAVHYGRYMDLKVRTALQSSNVSVSHGTCTFIPAGTHFKKVTVSNLHGDGFDAAIEFCPTVIQTLIQDEFNNFQLHYAPITTDVAVAKLVELMVAEKKHEQLSDKLYLDGLSIALIGLLRKKWTKNLCNTESQKGLNLKQASYLKDYISINLGEALRVPELAKLLNLSSDYFSKKFKSTFGVSPHQYVFQQRIIASKKMLTQDYSISEVAFRFGFSSHAHFSQLFRESVGVTPSDWRKANRKSIVFIMK